MHGLWGLCDPAVHETVGSECTTFEAWLGSSTVYVLSFMFFVWLAVVVIRLVWFAHQNLAYKASIDQLWTTIHAQGERIDDALLQIEALAKLTGEDQRNVMHAHQRITEVLGKVSELTPLKAKEPTDHAVECEVVPCTRGKPGRWVEAWVPFWPRRTRG